MASTIQIETKVLPGPRIEIETPELKEGQTVTVLITPGEDLPPKRPFWDVVGDYPGGKLFKTAEEVDAYLRAERDSWD
jgi:hypothetical protein